MQAIPNNDIYELMNIEENKKCFDCQKENPTFVSVNNAIFLCDTCYKMHKRLGENISKVKSLISDELTQEEIALLKIGGNNRYRNFIKEYGIEEEYNKMYKYHLKLAEYYRSLLLAEINKENNPAEYDRLVQNKPPVEMGLQAMETLTTENLKMMTQPPKSEFAQDMSDIAGKIGGFFSTISKKVNETAEKFGIPQKLDEARNKINEGVKNFGERHPKLQNAATKTKEAFTSAKNYTADKLNKIIESEAVKNVTGKINNKYNEVMNSETMKNLEKKTAEGYHNLKVKAGITKEDNNLNNVDNVEPQEQKKEEPLINNVNNEELKQEQKQEEPLINNVNNEELKQEPPKQDE